MYNSIALVVSIIGFVAVIFTSLFIMKEGKDERGYNILGKAGMTVYVMFLFGYSIIFTLNAMQPLNGEQFSFALTCLFALVVISYSATIFVLKRKY